MYLLNHKLFGHETRATNRCSHGQDFSEIFCMTERLGPKSRLFLISQSVAVNQKPNLMSS